MAHPEKSPKSKPGFSKAVRAKLLMGACIARRTMLSWILLRRRIRQRWATSSSQAQSDPDR